MSFYETLQALLREQGLSQSELERQIGLSRGSISKWKGDTSPSSGNLRRIADHFGVTVDFLTGRESSTRPVNDNDIKALLFDLPAGDVTDEMMDNVKQYAQATAADRDGRFGSSRPIKDELFSYMPGDADRLLLDGGRINPRLVELYDATKGFSDEDFDYILNMIRIYQIHRTRNSENNG